jgi:gag-polyprotein putative aspartyl protease
MGQLYTSINLINATDLEMARRLMMDPDDIRQIKVRALVDTGALMMTINENIQEYLQLPVVDYKRMEMANGNIIGCPIVFPLIIRCMDETAHCSAVVMPGDSEPLLGAIPLEEMNLVIDVQRLELIPNTKLQRIGGWRFVD